MRIAIAGKGGTGKTTIAGTLARLMARRGRDVWAIDADSNPNLAVTLGLPRDAHATLAPVPRSILQPDPTDAEGKRRVLGISASEVARQFGHRAPDNVTLLLMGRVDHAGAGWMCGAHAAVRHLIGGILEDRRHVTIVDMEAGIEHMSRGTGRHVDTLLVTLEPYYKALETSRRCAELGRELNIPRVAGVGNKIRDTADADAVHAYAAAHGIELVASIPFDDRVRLADLEGTPFVDAPRGAAASAMDRLADWLIANN